MKKKIILIVIALTFFNINLLFAISSDYYSLRAMLATESDDNFSYGEYPENRSKDLDTILKMLRLLQDEDLNDLEIQNELGFVHSALSVLIPLTEYDDLRSGVCDHFGKCSSKKKELYSLFAQINRNVFVNKILKNDPELTRKTANNIAEIITCSLLLKENNQYFADVYSMFDEGIYNMELITNYLIHLDRHKMYDEAKIFSEKYLDKISKSNYEHGNLGLLVNGMVLLLPEEATRRYAINKILDKIEGEEIKFFNAGDRKKNNSYLINALSNQLIISDRALNSRVVQYLKNDKKILQDTELDLLSDDTIHFLDTHKSLIRLDDDIVRKLNDVRSKRKAGVK